MVHKQSSYHIWFAIHVDENIELQTTFMKIKCTSNRSNLYTTFSEMTFSEMSYRFDLSPIYLLNYPLSAVHESVYDITVINRDLN